MVFFEYMGENPARWYYRGDLSINPSVFFRYSPNVQKYIIGHELGHKNLNTKNEILADDYGFKINAGKFENSLRDSVKSLSEVLNFSIPEHDLRLKKQMLRALKFDYEKYGNKKALLLIKKIESTMNNSYLPKNEYDHSDLFGIHLGLTQASRDAAAQDRALKAAKKQANVDIKTAKAAAIAQSGVAPRSVGDTITSGLGSAASIVGSIFSKKNEGAVNEGMGGAGDETQKSSNTTMYVVIAVVVIAIIGFFLLKKKGK